MFRSKDVQVLLIERDEPPFAGTWALPGGFVLMDEDLEEAARREIEEETGIESRVTILGHIQRVQKP